MTTGNKLPRDVLVPAEKRYRPEIQGRRPFLIVATGSGKTIPDAVTPVASNRYGEQAYGRLTLPPKTSRAGFGVLHRLREGELDEREAVYGGADHCGAQGARGRSADEGSVSAARN